MISRSLLQRWCVAYERRRAHATSCALVSAEAAVCGSGGAPAMPRAFALRRRRRGACNGCWIIFGCILTTYYATMHRFASALHPTLFRTPPPPHVASWQSWLRLFDIAFYDGRRLCFRGSSCQPRRRSIISTRSRSHLLKAAKVRLGQFRILKPDTKNESTTNTRLTTHHSPSASRQPSPSAAS